MTPMRDLAALVLRMAIFVAALGGLAIVMGQ
jgi:hypothetical protein